MHTAGVKRQYLGCAGRVANGINVVYASYTAPAVLHPGSVRRAARPNTLTRSPSSCAVGQCRRWMPSCASPARRAGPRRPAGTRVHPGTGPDHLRALRARPDLRGRRPVQPADPGIPATPVPVKQPQAPARTGTRHRTHLPRPECTGNCSRSGGAACRGERAVPRAMAATPGRSTVHCAAPAPSWPSCRVGLARQHSARGALIGRRCGAWFRLPGPASERRRTYDVLAAR